MTAWVRVCAQGELLPGESLVAWDGDTPILVVNLDGETNLLAAGLSWKLGDRLYARPGIGIAIHDGPDFRVDPATARHRWAVGADAQGVFDLIVEKLTGQAQEAAA